jgi:iron complex transport system substrate-binding protein
MRKFVIVLVVSLLYASLAVTSGFASNCTLKIFGNANMDGTIDEGDIEYVQGIIEGTNDETELADANYDGQIDEEDIAQIELIIGGEEEQLTLIDMADRVVTIEMPVERVVLADLLDGIDTLVQLGAEDKIVGIVEGIKTQGYGQLIDQQPSSWWTPLQEAAPDLKDLPTVGTIDNLNLEEIVSLKPDVIFAYGARGLDAANTIQEKTEIPTICLTNNGGSNWAKLDDDGLWSYRLIGWVVGKEDEAEELISYIDDRIGEITEITSEIPDSEKPRVYMAGWTTYLTMTPLNYDPIDLAGGMNVAKEAGETFFTVEVSKEQILAWNPEIIVIHRVPTSKSHVWGNSIDKILSDPDLQSIDAVKNNRIYYTKGFCYGWDPATGIVETLYLAKLFHPDKFEDLDVEAAGNDILEHFYGAEGLYTEMSERCEFYKWE